MNDVVAEIIPKAERPVTCAKCPFCQSASIAATQEDLGDRGLGDFRLECMTCGASGPPAPFLSDATRKWNQRF